MSTPEFEIHRAIVHSSNVLTGEALVRIPSLLGAGQVVSVPTTGLTSTAGDMGDEWNVPAAGSSVFVAVSADRTQFLWLTALSTPTNGPTTFDGGIVTNSGIIANGGIDAQDYIRLSSDYDAPFIALTKEGEGTAWIKKETGYVSINALSDDETTVQDIVLDGSVAIGTTTPANNYAKLTITDGYYPSVYIIADETLPPYEQTDAALYFGDGTNINHASIAYDSYNEKLFVRRRNFQSRLTLDVANGNVGIGTTSPSATLDVNGDVNVSGQSYTRANWCAMSGPRQFKSAYWNTWYHIAWNTGALGSVVCYPHIDTTLLEYDGIEIFRTGHFLVEYGQRNNGGTYNAYGGIGESGSRVALAGASHNRGTDGIWSHDHASNNSSWIHSYYIGRLYEGDIVTAGPSSNTDASNMLFANGNYAGFLSVIWLGDHDGT